MLVLKRFHSLILSLLWLGGSYPLLVSATRPLFNVRLLELDRPIEVDISQFNRPDNLPEGEYQVDIYVNDRFIARRAVRFFALAYLFLFVGAPAVRCLLWPRGLQQGLLKAAMGIDAVVRLPLSHCLGKL